MSEHKIKWKWLVLFASFIFFLSILAHHQVDNSLTQEDKKYIREIIKGVDLRTALSPRNYMNEIRFIKKVQSSVLKLAPDNTGIPYNQKREPKNLYFKKSGLCYDRSRVIEKILRYSGFKTRHIAIYSLKNKKSALKALFSPQTASHAVTEVLTQKGWLVVDSNDDWISIDSEKKPISIKQIQGDVLSAKIPWNSRFPSNIYEKPFTFIYGLYSRHGRFYPPYNFIPDINYRELIVNFIP